MKLSSLKTQPQSPYSPSSSPTPSALSSPLEIARPRVLYLAFNSAIVAEVCEKVNSLTAKAARDFYESVATAEQRGAINDIIRASGITCIPALAGTGKTTTVLAGGVLYLLDRTRRYEFNPRDFDIATTHSFGRRYFFDCFPTSLLHARHYTLDKVIMEFDCWRGIPTARKPILAKAARLLSSRYKTSNIYREDEGRSVDLDYLAEEDVFISPAELPNVLDAVSVMESADFLREHHTFDDYIWVPCSSHCKPIVLPPQTLVLVDEFQDLNPCQLQLVRNLTTNDEGRYRSEHLTGIVCVGDSNQAIYGWRGASSKAMEEPKQWSENVPIEDLPYCERPLTHTARCSTEVTNAARILVPEFQTLSKIDGRVSLPRNATKARKNLDDFFASVSCADRLALSSLRSTFLVLSRRNAPLFPLVVRALKMGIPFRCRMDHIYPIKTLWDTLSRSPGNPRPLSNTVASSVDQWFKMKSATIHRQPISARARISLLTKLNERYDVLRHLVSLGLDNADDLLQKIINASETKSNTSATLTFSTIHGAKGAEADHVLLLTDYMPDPMNGGKYEDLTDSTDGERNLLWVALTRAKITFTVGGNDISAELNRVLSKYVE